MASRSSLVFVVARPSPLVEEAAAMLAAGGREVRSFGCGQEVLQQAAVAEPGVVVSDSELEDMDGHELQAAYGEAFPHRRTPFLLLVDRPWPVAIVQLLANGTHDYLLLSATAEQLVAKVSRQLASDGVSVVSADGTLGELSLREVLDFCRRAALDGDLEVTGPWGELRLELEEGMVRTDSCDLDPEALEAALARKSGSFAILSRLEAGRRTRSAPPPRSERLPAKVTGVAVGDHLVSVETEQLGEGEIATLVTVDGTPRRRTTSVPPPRSDRHALEQYMAAQHDAVAAGVRGRLEALMVQKGKRAEPSSGELERYLWMVREACARRQYAAAREVVAGAVAMFPSDPALVGYQRWLRSKSD